MIPSLRLCAGLVCIAIFFPIAVVAEERSSPPQDENTIGSDSASADIAKSARVALPLEKQTGVEKRLEDPQVRKVEPWPTETEEEHTIALQRSRKRADEVVSRFPRMQLYERKHFLFASNIPQQQVGPYVESLDRMYDYMCKLYNIPTDRKVWLGGKASIFAFVDSKQMEAFEKRYYPQFQRTLRKLQAPPFGICHRMKDGEVVISAFRGNNPDDLGYNLVHETSHGFNHRYKNKCTLPNWVDEGMADLIAAEIVPASSMIRDNEILALRQLSQQRSFGGMFSAEHLPNHAQYGMASSLNRFLVKSDEKSYVRFIDGLKEGMPWPEALRAAYHKTPDEMLAYYGQAIGVQDLRP